jgi:hypothetical protein
MSKTISVKDVPEYLKSSEFFLNNLEIDTNFTITIDEHNFKENTEVNNLEDFILLYNTCNFWDIPYPEVFYSFFNSHKQETLNFLKEKNIELWNKLRKNTGRRVEYQHDNLSHVWIKITYNNEMVIKKEYSSRSGLNIKTENFSDNTGKLESIFYSYYDKPPSSLSNFSLVMFI